ncbi:MAG: VOC family protein [Betaproteobacteria bacterium]
MPNPFVHIELQTADVPKAKEFYGQLFNWKLQDVPAPSGGTYTMISVGNGTGGGIYTKTDANIPSHWLAYVGVDDVHAMTEKARGLGATVCVEVTEVGNFGLMSVFIDPTGATLALWQSR